MTNTDKDLLERSSKDEVRHAVIVNGLMNKIKACISLFIFGSFGFSYPFNRVVIGKFRRDDD